jgi:hypothetical protein
MRIVAAEFCALDFSYFGREKTMKRAQIAALLSLCLFGVHADADTVQFSSPSPFTETTVIQEPQPGAPGVSFSDTITFDSLNGSANGGDLFTTPFITYYAGCFRSACAGQSAGITAAEPMTLTDQFGQMVSASLTYSAEVFIDQAGEHFVEGGPEGPVQFAFSDGELWSVTELQGLGRVLTDAESVSFGEL